MIRPQTLAPLLGHRGKGGRFYPAMYAARSIPLGVLVAVVVWLDPAQSSTVLVLAAAAAAQLGDMLIGVVHRVPGMVVIPLAAAVLHLAGATYRYEGVGAKFEMYRRCQGVSAARGW